MARHALFGSSPQPADGPVAIATVLSVEVGVVFLLPRLAKTPPAGLGIQWRRWRVLGERSNPTALAIGHREGASLV